MNIIVNAHINNDMIIDINYEQHTKYNTRLIRIITYYKTDIRL